MQPANVAAVYDLLGREISSLLHYLADAWPWAGGKEREVITRIQALIRAERDAHQKLATALRRQRVVPPSPRFPMEYTTFHYVAMDFLLPRVIGQQQELLARLEDDIKRVADDADAKHLLEPVLALKRKHLVELERLAAEHSGAKSLATVR
jgi:hypothetical protein